MDLQEIRKTLDVFRTDNGLIEIRIFSTLNKNENYSGIFDNEEDLVREVNKFDKEPYNTYFVFNEIKDALNGYPQYNKLVRGAPTVKDENVKYRRWILIDLDPIRDGGVKDIASTDEEMERSKEVAREVRKYLASAGFKSPVVCASGNGTHLLYKLDNVPNTREVDTAISNFLNYLSLRYTTSEVDCDIKVKNAARLTKFYSSTSRKGGNTPHRPHRKSEILVVPKNIECIDFSLVEQISEEYKKIAQPEDPNRRDTPNQQNRGDREKFDIDNFLATHGIEVYKEERLEGNTRKLILKTCPFNPDHGKDSAIFVSDKGIVFTCFHNGCSGYTWRDLRLKFDPHAYDYENQPQMPYYPQQRGYMPPPQKKAYEIKAENPEIGKKWFSMSDIEKVDLSNLFVIKTGYIELDKKIGGLYEGEITILSGSNSSGKSSWINNLILNVVNQGEKVALWSGELPPAILKSWILQSAAGKKHIKASKYEVGKSYVPQDIAKRIDSWMDGKFFLYNNDYSNKFQQIFNDMEEMVELGVRLFILDNLFSLDIDIFEGDKNNKQKELILKLGDFVKKNKIHLMLVAHPRKVTSFLRKNDISGTADLGNAASNILICHRVNNDFFKSGGEFLGEAVVKQYATFGNCIEICKNRLYGAVDCLVGMHYEIDTRRFKNTEEEYIHYGWEEQPQSQSFEMPYVESEFSSNDFSSDFDRYDDGFSSFDSASPF